LGDGAEGLFVKVEDVRLDFGDESGGPSGVAKRMSVYVARTPNGHLDHFELLWRELGLGADLAPHARDNKRDINSGAHKRAFTLAVGRIPPAVVYA
jgi:hypothetical protein